MKKHLDRDIGEEEEQRAQGSLSLRLTLRWRAAAALAGFSRRLVRRRPPILHYEQYSRSAPLAGCVPVATRRRRRRGQSH